jgi:hypothetical protein
LDGDVYGTGAEGADEEPGEAAGAIDGEEFEVVAGGNVQIERLPIPRVIDAQLMPPEATGSVTVWPYKSSATGLPSSFTMIWRSWISSGEVRRMVIWPREVGERRKT